MRRGKVGTFEVRHYRLRYFHRQTPLLLLLITSHFPPILVRQKMGLTWDSLGTYLGLICLCVRTGMRARFLIFFRVQSYCFSPILQIVVLHSALPCSRFWLKSKLQGLVILHSNTQGVTGVTEVTALDNYTRLLRLPRLPHVCIYSQSLIYIEG